MHANTSTAAISADTSGAGAAPPLRPDRAGPPERVAGARTGAEERGDLQRNPAGVERPPVDCLRPGPVARARARKDSTTWYPVRVPCLDLYGDDSAWIYMATNLRLPEYSVVGAKLATKLKN